MAKDGSLWSMGTDLDHGALMKNNMHYRSWAFYPTSDPTVYYYIMGSLRPASYLRSFGLDPEAPVKSNDEAYELQKSVFSNYSARELEQKCIELGLTLTAGKSTQSADLNKQEDAERVHKLVEEADVVIQGFRKGAIERKGFGLNNVLAMANKRGKGIVYLDLNCYGPDGTSAERPGSTGAPGRRPLPLAPKYICGKAYGFPEDTSVLPSLPVADMLTGVSGACEVMMALRDRAFHGGPYHCDAALTATDTIQCEPEMGLYLPEIVAKIQEKYHFGPMTPDLHVEDLMANVGGAWAKSGMLDNKSFYQCFDESPFGKDHTILSPIVHFEEKDANPQSSRSPRP
ncbi:hypothetical protein B0A55_10220 [Friedmanniomyces simplex]|uniref:Uncharacterized protein n=1 Tax=Friedmanniomyces simplex TaxID=329884 RepID=A0A4U0WCH2_9PEZI|nr:hypothetical protein B0A55_10220 [Friedmanniomyces simplex]